MNYNKVIKDLKERNDKLQEQYSLRDIRCIHLEYENEMLKSDFKAQHELTKKYAEESKELKKQLEEKENIACNWKDSCLENAGKIEILETQQKEFINYLEDKINYYKRNTQCFSMNLIEEILQKYKSIIGVSNENN